MRMPVYVDDARIPWRGHVWSHMVAETAEELHRAAEALGIGRERVQDKGRTLHYDLPEEWRLKAIALGVAQPIGRRELVQRRAGFAVGRKALHRKQLTPR
jgi:hypothetical protein